MRLEPGDPAPAFPASDYLGRMLPPPGRNGRLIAFFRYADCPICNLRIRDLRKKHNALSRAGLEALAVFQSPAAHLAESLGGEEWPFPLIADEPLEHYRAWGVETSWAGLLSPWSIATAFKAMATGHLPSRIDGPVHRMPADFVVDDKGVITLAHYGHDAGEHLPLEHVWRWIMSLD